MPIELKTRYIRDETEEFINYAFSEMLGGYYNDEYRKWGIKNNGLCLVVAWAISIEQSLEMFKKQFIKEKR